MLRWLLHEPGLAALVARHDLADRLLHFLAHRALKPQSKRKPGCSCGLSADSPSDTGVAEGAQPGGPGLSYWEGVDVEPSFDAYCDVCGLSTSQRLDDVVSSNGL